MAEDEGAAIDPQEALKAAQQAAEDARLAQQKAEAALAAAQAAAASSAPAPEQAEPASAAPVPEAAEPAQAEPASAAPAAPEPTPENAPEPAGATSASAGPLSPDAVAKVIAGYTFAGSNLNLGALINTDPVPEAQIRIPFGMLNRHGLVAGATGTGKTKTLQGLAEQISDGGVPVFAADIKGDLSGLAVPGAPSDKLTERTRAIGQDWQPHGHPTEFFSLGGMGTGIALRASVERFGSVLLAKVLDLNDTQESSLGLVFHYAQTKQLPLITLADLQTVLTYLTSSEGKTELAGIGGLSSQSVGVILREIVTLIGQGGDVFFGEPQVDVADFLRTTSDGKGIVSMLELAGVQDKPLIFSTFLMWLLTELYRYLPEVGDQDKPKLVFFFDEAHLLFSGASKSFVQIVTQTVRLIRSKGVGIFFVTQTPKDVPGDVLAQLGSRVQHALRAYTPDDAKALKATVSTYPKSEYDLEETLTQLGTGEAIVTVMNEKGAPTPVAWTRMRAPEGSMEPAPADTITSAINASTLLAKYSQPAQTRGAAVILGEQMAASAAKAKELADAEAKLKEQQAAEKIEAAKASKQSKSGSSRSSGGRKKDSVGETVAKNVIKAATSATVINTVLRAILKKK